MINTLARMLAIAAIAVGATFAWRPIAPLVHAPAMETKVDIPKLNAQKALKDSVAITLEDFRVAYESGAIVIDARESKKFAAGHLDAPMIMNIPEDGNAMDHVPRLQALQGNKFVLYCNSEACDAAMHLYEALAPLGLGEIRVYHQGWEGIEKAKLPVTAGPETVP